MKRSLTFDDVLMVPGFSQVLPADVDLRTKFSRNIDLNIPLVSAAMDTVTESRLAIAMAQLGGIGVIHRNMDAKKQAAEVALVKRYESGIVRNPITLEGDETIAEGRTIMKHYGISAIPIVDNDGSLRGIVTKRDLRFADNENESLAAVMTYDNLVYVNESEVHDEQKIRRLLHENKIEKVLVVQDDIDMELTGLVTSLDIQKKKDYPQAVADKEGRLRVAAAIGGMPTQGNLERAEKLIAAGVDALVIDCAHGHTQNVIDTIIKIRTHLFQGQKVDLVGGNVATREGAFELLENHIDAIKVGIGPGSICTTRVVAGIGVPQFTAIQEVASIKTGNSSWDDFLVPIIADGGIRYSGDMAKAIGIGADCVMIGSLFAGTEEAPGETELYKGRTYKSYRGMGSISAMEEGSADRYFQGESTKLVPEGIEGRVPYKGPLEGVVHQLTGGLRSSMGYTGKENIKDMKGQVEFTQITAAGVTESHPHDVDITKEAPNYQVRR